MTSTREAYIRNMWALTAYVALLRILGEKSRTPIVY